MICHTLRKRTYVYTQALPTQDIQSLIALLLPLQGCVHVLHHLPCPLWNVPKSTPRSAIPLNCVQHVLYNCTYSMLSYLCGMAGCLFLIPSYTCTSLDHLEVAEYHHLLRPVLQGLRTLHPSNLTMQYLTHCPLQISWHSNAQDKPIDTHTER